MKKISVCQLLIKGNKLNVRRNEKINVDCSYYASTGYSPLLEQYRDINTSWLDLTLQFDLKTEKGMIYHKSGYKPEEEHVSIWRKYNRIYVGIDAEFPIIIELKLDSVWIRAFSCRACETLDDLSEELFRWNAEISESAQQGIMRLNSAIALGDVELDDVKPAIY